MTSQLSVRHLSIATLILALILPATALARSGGVASSLNQDRTGSPLASGPCSSCHQGGSGFTDATLRVLDANSMEVTQVDAGQTYTVEMTVQNMALNAYGGQLAALTPMNQQAGTFANPSTNDTQISQINGVEYLEHSGRSSTGVFSASWTAPSTTDTVTFYFVGLGVNGTGSTAGDVASPPQAIVINVNVPACTDFDMDTVCDDMDADDDNDGVLDGDDPDSQDATVCGDSDQDSCDDCSVGVDGIGEMSDVQTDNDGPDADGDGLCDAGDACLGDNMSGDADSDGVCDDMDVCDGDDASGDSDNDGLCDDSDPCTGQENTMDSDADGVCDDLDICEGNDAAGDANGNGICDDNDPMDMDMGMADMGSDMAMDMDMSQEDMTTDVDMTDSDMGSDMAMMEEDMASTDEDMAGLDDMGITEEDMTASADMGISEQDMGAGGDMMEDPAQEEDPGEVQGSGCATAAHSPADKPWPLTLLAGFGLFIGFLRRKHRA